MIDPSLVIYVISFLTDVYGVSLFAWWWIKRRSATLMFKCVTVLFLGDMIERAVNIYGRWITLYGYTGQYTAFSKTPWFGTRTIISTVATLIVVIYMTRRVVQRLEETEDHPRRRASD